MLIIYSFKNLTKYPKSEKYNENDLITNPNEIKNLILYLEQPGDDEEIVRVDNFNTRYRFLKR